MEDFCLLSASNVVTIRDCIFFLQIFSFASFKSPEFCCGYAKFWSGDQNIRFKLCCGYAKFLSGDQNIRFKLINCFAICTVGKKNVFLILIDNNLFRPLCVGMCSRHVVFSFHFVMALIQIKCLSFGTPP